MIKSHQAQLEILVALKIGLPEYILCDNGICSTDMAEIFFKLRCKNLTCRYTLPTGDCDYNFWTKKNDFCSLDLGLAISNYSKWKSFRVIVGMMLHCKKHANSMLLFTTSRHFALNALVIVLTMYQDILDQLISCISYPRWCD